MLLRAMEVAEATGGRLVGPDVACEGAGIDSRTLAPGSLFVPVVGERDGHDFVGAALAAGAVAYLTARSVGDPPAGVAAIEVADTVRALTDLGRLARERAARATVIGVTGSVGKTTTKDLLAAALTTRRATAASYRSFNNELGVPLTLLNAPDDTDAIVVEMGARGAGHIADLCEIARPTIGVITTVEGVHTELFGGLEEVASAKGELVAALPAEGRAVLNGDNPLVAAMAPRSAAPVWRASVSAPADLWASGIEIGRDLRTRFTMHTPLGTIEVTPAARGAHNVMNVLLAAGAALAAGVDLDAIASGLSAAASSPWRMELAVATSGAWILNDAYNAGPSSMAAALVALAHLPADRRIAVLGVMAELGPESPRAHEAIAAQAAELDVEVIAVAAPAYGTRGVEHVADVDSALSALRARGPLDEQVAILVKGSRIAGLERVAAALCEG
jgi:UDP-N-acetylmuramoyl-tripeptide--D-alanyl-D-alanine ligase